MDLVENTMVSALFRSTIAPPPLPRELNMRHQPRYSDDFRSRKKERNEMDAARRASFVFEVAQQMRARELVAGASSSRLDDVERITTKGSDIVVDTNEGVSTTYLAGSRN